MTDIRDYPNPLLQQLSDQFGLGLTFDANGAPQFNGTKITLAQFDAFLDAALEDETNLYRLMPDGTFIRPEIKVFYDRSIEVDSERVFNSVLANDFTERAGSAAVSLDRTALGQLLFRSRLADEVVDPDLAQEAEALWSDYDIRIAAGEENVPIPDLPRDAGRATEELRTTLDGGEGDDWIFVLGGTGAIAVGGEGSDLIYNSSYKGQLWGDGLDGRGASYSGGTNDDTFWWSAGSFIMDAGKNDRLQLFGLPLVGGTNSNLFYGIALEKGTARDFLLPWVTYGMSKSGQLLVEAGFSGANLDPSMSEEEILEIAQVVENWEAGDLGTEFSIFGGDDEISLFSALFKFIGDFAGHIGRFAKNLLWLPSDDPLVLDLNGDGLVSRGIGAVYWDNDGDLFGERSGWLSGEDGFLVHDADSEGLRSLAANDNWVKELTAMCGVGVV